MVKSIMYWRKSLNLFSVSVHGCSKPIIFFFYPSSFTNLPSVRFLESMYITLPNYFSPSNIFLCLSSVLISKQQLSIMLFLLLVFGNSLPISTSLYVFSPKTLLSLKETSILDKIFPSSSLSNLYILPLSTNKYLLHSSGLNLITPSEVRTSSPLIYALNLKLTPSPKIWYYIFQQFFISV